MVITGNPFSFREEAIVDFPAPGIPVRQIIILFCFFILDSFPILLFAVYLVYYVRHSEKLSLILFDAGDIKKQIKVTGAEL
jgi:hypothetical protein